MSVMFILSLLTNLQHSVTFGSVMCMCPIMLVSSKVFHDT